MPKFLKDLKLTAVVMLPLLIAFICAGPVLGADDNFGFGPSTAKPAAAGMCDGQAAINDKELRDALAVMGDIISMGPDLKPADEETIIRGRGLTSERLNCLLGKIMAGNDIFGWGSPEAYGVSLTTKERDLVRKYNNESEGLKQYLEEALNIKVED